MLPTKKLLLTFDYELFLGQKSGSVEKCMIEPTDKLIELFEKLRINHCIFFVDTTYLIRLKKQAQTSTKALTDYESIKSQLQRLIAKKHYVFPHIHPHWLDAIYLSNNNQWRLDNLRYYRFNALNNQQQLELFNESIELLEEIIHPLNPSYKIDGYRAGGWCIQPFTDFYNSFKKHGIQYEFSVLAKMKNLSNAQFYDFSNAPAQPIYSFEQNILEEAQGGSFKEFAISSLPISASVSIINKLLLKVLLKTGNRSWGDGSGVVSISNENNEDQGRQKLEMISMELLNISKLDIYKKFLQKYDYMHFISHPKMLSKHNLYTTELFLKNAKNRYLIETDFKKM